MDREGRIQVSNRARGFTLLELMIVVVVLSILVGVGYPSYRGNVIQSKRSVARAALTEFASRQESFYLDRKQYATTPSALGYPANTVNYGSDGQLQPSGSVNSDTVYSLTFASSGARSYTVQAIPQNGQADDSDCGTLTLTNNGKKGASGTSTARCW